MAAAKDASQAAADGVVSSQRLADAARWEAVAASVGTLPGLQGAGEAAAAALLAGAGSLGAVAAAGVDDLLLLCGGNANLAECLWRFFSGELHDAGLGCGSL
jgi:hypothetical protein